jgi:hypothetical protein
MKRDLDPASWLEKQDEWVRILLAELVTYSGELSEAWSTAVQSASSDPAAALSKLTECEVAAQDLIGFRVSEIRRVVRSAIKRYDAFLDGDPPIRARNGETSRGPGTR